MKLRWGIAYALILGSMAAGPAQAIEPDPPETLISRLDAVELVVQDRLAESFRDPGEYEKREHGALVEFYSGRKEEPVWVDEDGMTSRAHAVMDTLRRAGDYGLDPADYDLPDEAIAAVGAEYPSERLAAAEIKVSRAALAYARHARGGRVEWSSVSKMLDPTLNLPDPLEVMEGLAGSDDPAAYLLDFQPKNPQFEALRQVLLDIRGDRPEEHVRLPEGPVLRQGESHPQIAILRERLDVPVTAANPEAARDATDEAPEARSGDNLGEAAEEASDEAPEEVFDASLETALKDFQRAKGLRVDGILGPNTRSALNGGRPKNRVKTILTNMERWRWMPDDMDERLYVNVNIPEYRVRVFDKGKPVFTERVVVGKTENPTPLFSDEMEYLVFNPYWNVPNSIKVKEILPYLRRDTGGFGGGWFSPRSRPRVLARHNLYVKYRGRQIDASRINWSRANITKYHFYQPPGGQNVLGFVKFMFPNDHIVYLHDTPTKNLFERHPRTYSHGCVRVRNPRRLAEIIMSRDAGWSPRRIDAAIGSGRNQRVNLNEPVPIHLTYFTARVGEDGEVEYFSDVYGHDSRMVAALNL